MTGPVAQPSQRMFDDMQGADARACLQSNPLSAFPGKPPVTIIRRRPIACRKRKILFAWR
ncbi:MAG: hypothetical protein IPJ94_27720 [Chloroflexi bacterium]|nr:hypothetical protein [Chloroflexota bacterium]